MNSVVSVILLTYNEEVNICDCLKSVAQLGAPLFVVDSGSTDGSLDIARAFGASIVSHPFENYAAQRNWAQQNLPIKTEWVLHLDADERLTPELVQEIHTVLRSPEPSVGGYLFRKRTIFLGRWIRYGGHYPSYHLRLFRRAAGSCENKAYDQHFVLHSGEMRRMRSDYCDVVTSDLNTWTIRHCRWAALEALDLIATTNAGRVKPRLFGSPIERKRWFRVKVYGRAPMMLRPFMYWFYRYFLRFGFLDGEEGFLFHFLHAWWYRVLVDFNVRQLRARGSSSGPSYVLDAVDVTPPLGRTRG